MKPVYLTFLILICGLSAALCQNTPQIPVPGPELMATDGLGRTIADWRKAGPRKSDRYVGLFYWLWHGGIRNSATEPDSINISKILKANPRKTDWRMQDFYWDEPEEGFYRSADPWVMRRQLQLFALADVDFLFLDLTNDELYPTEMTLLCDMIILMRGQGIKVPYLVPFLNVRHGIKVKSLYRDYYQKEKYDQVWFRWQGKPLIMSPLLTAKDVSDSAERNEIINHFTWKPTWALFDENIPGGKWRFMDYNPQRSAYDVNGKIEQYVVAKSIGAPLWNYKINGSSSGLNHSLPVDQYWLTAQTGRGYFFNEQWNRADSVGAPILLITGWNELKAGAWPASQELADQLTFAFQGRKLKKGDMYFVDEFNREFNRDLQPMKNEDSDNFYYQLVDRIRRYKGMAAPESKAYSLPIKIDGLFTDWNKTRPVFTDFEGDVEKRDFAGVQRGLTYLNTTGRNDIIESRASNDRDNLYFYVKTKTQMTTYQGKNWMLLFIDADLNKRTGWQGYDYLINSTVISETLTTVKRWNKEKWEFVRNIPYAVNANQMEIRVPLKYLPLTSGRIAVNFHWADNIQKLGDISEFFNNGDSAPERRFDYHFQSY